MNLIALIEQELENGYSEENARAKVCQDLILDAIANGPLNRNLTIKGGVVMRSRTNDIRRATQDLDMDFIKYSLSDESIDAFISKLNCLDGVHFSRDGAIKALKQQDYKGKRVYIRITDDEGHSIRSKIDLGVHVRLDIAQEEYCFDIAFDENGASLLINSNEQMLAEKIRSLLRFGTASTRYKDIADIYYLIEHVDKDKLNHCLNAYVYEDDVMHESNASDVVRRLQAIFSDEDYRERAETSKRVWMDIPLQEIFEGIVGFFECTGGKT